MSSKRTPPILIDDDYDTWEKEIKLWQCVTDLEKKKQGPMVYLSLEGKARQCCADLDVTTLNSEEGLDKLMERMKTLYAKNEEQAAFLAYEAFESFTRPSHMKVMDFINEFERRYSRIKAKKMDLPDGVLAYRILRSANLSTEHQTLARATIDKLTYENMKKQIRAIFDKVGISGRASTDPVPVKVEPAYYGNSVDEEMVYFTNPQTVGYHNKPRGFNKADHRGVNLKRGGHNSYQSRRGSRDSSKRGQHHRNPLDRYGNPSKCAFCQSTMHWVKDCPHADNAEVKINLFTDEISQVYMTQFVNEASNAAVLDSGCSRNVCGEEWFKLYTESLSKSDGEEVVINSSDSKFKFGDGEIVKSQRKVTFPAYISNQKIFITTDVIDKELPLLMSKDAMKKAGTTIDFKNDNVTMFGKTINLKFTSSGHYIIPINRDVDVTPKDDVLVLINSSLEELLEDKRKAGLKLHMQFGHARSYKIIDVIKDAGYEDVELFDHVKKAEENCEVCQRYKKPKARPVIGFSLARDFNDAVSMDLKWCNGELCLHMIDHMTRFSVASALKSKRKEEIVENIFKIWIALFGCPRKLLSDNGGEFNNELVREIGQLLNIRILSTAAEAPWSNGITERHNAIIGNMVERIMKDIKCSFTIALAWAVSAKNSLKNVYGYSPNQLVFGRNPNFPVVSENQLPALDGVTSSKLVAEHINAMHAARKAFIASESCDKLRRAMLKKTRTATSLIFEPGDLVYYKKNDSKFWRGAGEVMGKAGTQVWVKHGGAMFRVNPINLRKVREDGEMINEGVTEETEETEETEDKMTNGDNGNFQAIITNLMKDFQMNDYDEGILPFEAPETVDEDTNQNEEEMLNYEEPGLVDEEVDLNSPIEHENDHPLNYLNTMFDEGTNPAVIEGEMPKINPTIINGEMPKNGSKIKYILPNDQAWISAKVISRAGKVNGSNRWWVNVQNVVDEGLCSIDLSAMKAWRYVNEEVLLASSSDCNDVLEAKSKELHSWKSHDVYTEVDDIGQDSISVRWVVTEKVVNGDKQVKARLVAKGFEEECANDLRKDSPTCSKENLRLLCLLASSMKWKIKSLDIKSAFLQGDGIDRKVYLKPPKEAGVRNMLWLLKKTVYGLGDASRKWYLNVKEELLKSGVENSKFDEALFFWRYKEKLNGLLVAHVDDFATCGTSQYEELVLENMRKKFKISKEESETFKYIGLEIHQTETGIIMHQKKYIDSIQYITLPKKQSLETPLIENEFKELRRLIGQLSWVANHTRPDISFDVCQMSVNLKNAKLKDLVYANKVIKRIKTSEEIILNFPDLGSLKNVKLLMFSDASFANLCGGGSQGGVIIFLFGENGCYAPICWYSRKVKRVVKSTLASETLSLVEGVENCYLIRSVLKEILGIREGVDIIAFTDNKSLFEAAYSTKEVEDKRLKIDISILREMLNREEIKAIKWISSDKQLGDAFTKGGASTRKLLDAITGVAKLDEEYGVLDELI